MAVFPTKVQVYSLASGSSGNCYLVVCDRVGILLDAGIGPRKLSTQIKERGVERIAGIFVTHEHVDHISGLASAAHRHQAPVFANRETLQACDPLCGGAVSGTELPVGNEVVVHNFRVRSFAVSHDSVSPVGYVVECGSTVIAYITDTGCVTADIREALVGANLAIVESNHDVEWLLRGPYTREMKMRVRGPKGHLSNEECAGLVAERLANGGPMAVWLAHLSRVNNSPSLARKTVDARIRAKTDTTFALDVALRDHPSVQWTSGATAVQMKLF